MSRQKPGGCAYGCFFFFFIPFLCVVAYAVFH